MVKAALKLTVALLVLALGVAIPAAAHGQEVRSDTALHAAVTCAITPTTIVNAQPQRQGLLLVNNGTQTIFVGSGNPAALTTANGIPVAAGASMSFGQYRGAMQCIVVSATADLRYMETDK